MVSEWRVVVFGSCMGGLLQTIIQEVSKFLCSQLVIKLFDSLVAYLIPHKPPPDWRRFEEEMLAISRERLRLEKAEAEHSKRRSELAEEEAKRGKRLKNEFGILRHQVNLALGGIRVLVARRPIRDEG